MPKRISLTDKPQIYSERTLTEILPDTLVPFHDNGSGRVASIPVDFTFEEGGKYHVVFDREAYDLVYSAGLVLSNSSSLIFKLLVSNGDLEIYSDLSGSHTIQLYSVDEIVHKLPAKYAGIDSAGVARIVKDEFAGGVGYTETQTYSITWDGDTTGKTSVNVASGMVLYKVSDLTPELSDIQEMSITESNGSVYDGIDGVYASEQGQYWICNSATVACILKAGVITNGMTFPESGIYFIKYKNLYTSKLEFTTGIANTIDLKYIPSPPEFVVDATNLPTNCDAWGELCTSLEDAYNSGHDIFLDVYGNGGTKLKLTNHSSPYSLFLYPESRDTICAYILEAWYRDGGSLTKYSLTATEVT